jgi:hypothetical protein
VTNQYEVESRRYGSETYAFRLLRKEEEVVQALLSRCRCKVEIVKYVECPERGIRRGCKKVLRKVT